MAKINSYQELALTAGGGTHSLDATIPYDIYRVTGPATLTSNWTINDSGSAETGTVYIIHYRADIDLNGNTVTVFGTTLPAEFEAVDLVIIASYNGVAWEVSFNPDWEEDAILSLDRVVNLTRGYILRGNSASRPAAHLANGNTSFIYGDGTDVISGPMTGDGSLKSGALEVTTGTSSTASGVTQGLVRSQYIASAELKAMLGTGTNNLFAVKAGDRILKIILYVSTPAGAVCTVDIGGDASVILAGADPNGLLTAADANTAGIYSTDDPALTYQGAEIVNGTLSVNTDGYITITSSTNQAASAFVGGCTIYYIPA